MWLNLFVLALSVSLLIMFFFFNDTATTEIYTLSLHDALPILPPAATRPLSATPWCEREAQAMTIAEILDRKSTRLNSSHANISYAVFCLKKKNKKAPAHSLTKKKTLRTTNST